MPQLGEIKCGGEVGFQNKTAQFIWHACEGCGKERWVMYAVRKKSPRRLRCYSCAAKLRCHNKMGNRHPRWSGGRVKNGQGYILLYTEPTNFFYPMATRQNYILEHRLIMAKHLGRCLHPWEIVHHKNGIKDDNRLENLQLFPDKRFHLIDTTTKAIITQLRIKVDKQTKQIEEQGKQIRLLKWQLKNLSASITHTGKTLKG